VTYLLHLLIYFEIFVLVAVSLNVLVGYAGLLNIAHAAYFGVGAYTSTILTLKFGYGFVPAAASAVFMSGLLSLLISLPSWRLKGDAFVMVSIAVQMAIYAMFYNWIDLTSGPLGITDIPKPSIFGIPLDTQYEIVIMYGAIAALGVATLGFIKLSPFGRSLQAMRDDELAATSLGISTRKLKIQACFIATAVAALAGSLYASYASYIDPTSFTLDESILYLSMIIVGGTGNIKGPIIGALTLIVIPEIFRLIELPAATAANIRLLTYGFSLLLLMHLRPQGIAGRYRYE
jgi:branched-chain amino acid transport system permease protein